MNNENQTQPQDLVTQTQPTTPVAIVQPDSVKQPPVTGKTALVLTIIGIPVPILLPVGFILGLTALKVDPAGHKEALWAVRISGGIFLATAILGAVLATASLSNS